MEGTSGAAFGARGRSTWAMLFVRDGDGVPVSVVSGDVSQPQVAAQVQVLDPDVADVGSVPSLSLQLEADLV